MIVVIDYNVGNVKSVCNAFGHIGCDAKLSCEPADIESALGIVLPGVAAFGYAVSALGTLADVIKDAASGGKPLLGICVGYQMLFDQSSEYGSHNGLGLIHGSVVPLPADQRVPHMGWNLVKLYFAHSFYADVADTEAKIAHADYGFDLPAAVQKGNIYGTQFHPEKSGKTGLKVLQNFYEICEEGNR
ncbi:MAG: imidazole glycerol phosphate synthase subunit HisH [Planctomycetota bacterium]|jgi:glutamine amidotransferase